MKDLTAHFQPLRKEEWLQILQLELKKEDWDKLVCQDEIEEIPLHTIAHDSIVPNLPDPGVFPYTRGNNLEKPDWKNAVGIDVSDEKTANKEVLEALMRGADMVVFDLRNKTSIDYDVLFDSIGFEYIRTKLYVSDCNQLKATLDYFGEGMHQHIWFCIDPMANDTQAMLEVALPSLRNIQTPYFEINGYGIQQTGASAWQELTFCWSVAHEALCMLMSAGLTIDQASACIHFNMGVGSNYFMEIAKFRALRSGFTRIMEAYKPEHNCSYNCRFGVTTGFLNKSVLDVDTNLLRQTTETMSAIFGGAEFIHIQPVIIHSDSSMKRYKRMARNISLILKEEAHLDAYIDAIGGSHHLEELTQTLGEKAWEAFKEIEKLGGISQQLAATQLREKIARTASLRIKRCHEKEDFFIGINAFVQNQERKIDVTKIQETYFGLPWLSLETEYHKG
jgi:methylmalonyl-CoA mutase